MSVELINKFKEDIGNKRTAWIYSLTKDELLQICPYFNIDGTGKTVGELRKEISLSVSEGESDQIVIKKLPKMDINLSNIKAFDGNDYDIFEQQLDCLICLYDITNEKKTPLLLTKLTPKVFEKLTFLCAPKKPIEKSYKELCTILSENYNKSTSVALDKAEFRKRNQNQNENIEDYVLVLRKLSRRCKFSDPDDQIKEKLIDGVHNKMIKFELMKSAELPLEKVISLARTVESALLHSQSTKTIPDEAEMFYVKSKNQNNLQNKMKMNNARQENNNYQEKYNKNKSEQIKKCYCCGKTNHLKAECTLIKKFCSECGKQGHIFRMCKQLRERKMQVLAVEPCADQNTEEKEVEESITNLFEEYSVYTLSQQCKVRRTDPYCLQLNIEGFNLNFELDTGSEVTVMSLKDKQKYFDNKDIKKCNIIF